MSLVLSAGSDGSRWTDPIDYQLLQGGSAFNLTGYSAPSLDVVNASGVAVTWAGVVSFADQAAGKVRFSPGATDLAPGDYFVRFKVTSPTGKISFFPRTDRELWRVIP